MPDFFESLDRLCRAQPGRILVWIVGGAAAIVAAGAVVVFFLVMQGVEIDRMARATDTTLVGHIEVERENQKAVMGALGSIESKVGELGEDLGYVKGRLGLPRNASGPESVVYALPETQ